jgi:hypothetical protein
VAAVAVAAAVAAPRTDIEEWMMANGGCERNMKMTKQDRRQRRRARAGQAIAEFVVGLIALVVLFMGMLQIQYLAHNHTKALNDARAQAGQDALQTPYILRYNVPRWIGDWNNGRDNVIYSQDDTVVSGNPGSVTAGIVSHAHPTDLSTYAPGNELSAAANTATLIDGLMLTHGRERSPPVAMFPIIKHLVYDTDSITMQGDAWLTWAHIENVR